MKRVLSLWAVWLPLLSGGLSLFLFYVVWGGILPPMPAPVRALWLIPLTVSLLGGLLLFLWERRSGNGLPTGWNFAILGGELLLFAAAAAFLYAKVPIPIAFRVLVGLIPALLSALTLLFLYGMTRLLEKLLGGKESL